MKIFISVSIPDCKLHIWLFLAQTVEINIGGVIANCEKAKRFNKEREMLNGVRDGACLLKASA